MRLSKKCSNFRTLGALLLSAAGLSAAADLPTAKSIAAEMGVVWNIGNTMEVPNDPTAWGNPLPTQKLIDSVKAAGFKSIRIPCAWDSHANATTNVIDAAWMAQVKAVVDYAIKDSLFVVLNIHWDGGWLENRVDSSATDAAMLQRINKKQGAYWKQIATAFKSYDRHLLFASTNEPNVADSTGPDGSKILNTAGMQALNTFHQTFIDTVRATGGNNASRTLVVQGPSTNIEGTYKLMTTMPTDKIADRLMAEVHFYPYSFCLMEKDANWGNAAWYWGQNNHSTTDLAHNPTWGEEAYVDSMFNLMKVQFVDKNIPVLLGELGAIKRTNLTGDTLALHVLSRRTWYSYVVSAALSRGLIPAVWDAGGKGLNTMTVFDRATGSVYDLGLLNAIRSGAGLSKLKGDTSLVPVAGANAMRILYSAKDSLFGQVDLGVVQPDFSQYDSIQVKVYAKGKSSYDSAGVTKYGFISLSLVTMSDSADKKWQWREVSLGAPTMDAWKTVTVQVSSDKANKTALVPADPTKVNSFLLQMYSKGFNGAIYVDYVAFKKKTGTMDTLYSFNLAAPEAGDGNVQAVKMVPVTSVASDADWKTLTKAYVPAGIALRSGSRALSARVAGGVLTAVWSASEAGQAFVSLQDLQGRTVHAQSIAVRAGLNSVVLPVSSRGLQVLQVRQGARTLTTKVLAD